ncbi:MAG: hypothetical protein IKB64_08585 [Paludibacteraceae bacterium]|nr:hypothetical protein [Paludibacteraceae bacterium]
MTAGTAVVLSIAIICGTILALAVIGAITNNKRNKVASQLTSTITENIVKKLNK